MKKNLAYGLLVILIAVASCSFTQKSFETNDKDKLLLDLITYVLQKGHYEPKEINDDFSVSVFEDFINVVDPTKRYFLEEDILEFEKYKFQIDDQIKNTDIGFFNLVYDKLVKRMEEAKGIYKEVLEQPFDYSVNETIDINYDDQPFSVSKKELKERWRRQLKYATLGAYDSKVKANNGELTADAEDVYTEIEPSKNPNTSRETVRGLIKSAAEVEGSKKPRTLQEIEKEARESTRNTLDEFFDFVGELERKDWFVQYINTIVEEFDPHTYYFPPEEKEKFDTGMSGNLKVLEPDFRRKKTRPKLWKSFRVAPFG